MPIPPSTEHVLTTDKRYILGSLLISIIFVIGEKFCTFCLNKKYGSMVQNLANRKILIDLIQICIKKVILILK
jgi:hypothetical protein